MYARTMILLYPKKKFRPSLPILCGKSSIKTQNTQAIQYSTLHSAAEHDPLSAQRRERGHATHLIPLVVLAMYVVSRVSLCSWFATGHQNTHTSSAPPLLRQRTDNTQKRVPRQQHRVNHYRQPSHVYTGIWWLQWFTSHPHVTMSLRYSSSEAQYL